MMSPDMRQFYRELRAWCDGRNDDAPFRRESGLCANLSLWIIANNKNAAALKKELRMQFDAAGFDSSYPFNFSSRHFIEERDCYKNKYRMAWIADHALADDEKLKKLYEWYNFVGDAQRGKDKI